MAFDTNRRDFIKTSAGFLGYIMMPGVFHVQPPAFKEKTYLFKPYRPQKTLAPVQCITPDDGFYLHTFYDVCPWSFSERYVAVTRLPYQKRKPRWGDIAEVGIIDTWKQSIRTVYKTRAWGFQLGANLQWSHLSDQYLYTNDIIGGKVVAVRIDLKNNTAQVFAGPKYDLSPDDKSVISPNLMNMNMTQYGYSVPDPPSGHPIPFRKEQIGQEGLWKTDLISNQCSLLAPFGDFIAASDDSGFYERSIPYLFHSQFNRQNTRILQVLRGQIQNKGRNASLFTLNTDGTGIRQCLSREKWNYKGKTGGSGNHPNWHPDGDHVVMNCIPKWIGYENMMFCSFRYDGSDFKLLSEKHPGSGHPSIDPSSLYLLADAYPKQAYVTTANGEIPIRLIDLRSDEEVVICTIANDVGGKGKQYTSENKEEGGSQYKLDPHPVWSKDGKKIAFNGAPEGRRQVFIADVSKLVES